MHSSTDRPPSAQPLPDMAKRPHLYWFEGFYTAGVVLADSPEEAAGIIAGPYPTPEALATALACLKEIRAEGQPRIMFEVFVLRP